jgi:hypothetical protein
MIEDSGHAIWRKGSSSLTPFHRHPGDTQTSRCVRLGFARRVRGPRKWPRYLLTQGRDMQTMSFKDFENFPLTTAVGTLIII